MKNLLLIVTGILFTALSVGAQKSAVFEKSDKAIRGYDPVAYFTEGKPVEGKEEFVYNWSNANWYFSSRQHLDLFKANPGKYAPQYGGYCAYGLSRGYKAYTVPEAWTIDNGKLYLNYSLSVRNDWDKNRQERIQKADSYWPQIKDKN
ncbi:MAG: YHS domain-containing (seleno)protein [Bacteroidota bacterium]